MLAAKAHASHHLHHHFHHHRDRRHLTGMQQHVSDKHPLVGSGKAALRALVDLLMSMHLANVVLVSYWVEGGKRAEGAP